MTLLRLLLLRLLEELKPLDHILGARTKTAGIQVRLLDGTYFGARLQLCDVELEACPITVCIVDPLPLCLDLRPKDGLDCRDREVAAIGAVRMSAASELHLELEVGVAVRWHGGCLRARPSDARETSRQREASAVAL